MSCMESALRWVRAPLALTALGALLVSLDRQASGMWPPQRTLEREVRASPAMLSNLSFGLSPLVADYLWIDAVQYFGGTLGRHVHDVVGGRIVERGVTGEDVQTAAKAFHALVRRLMDVDPYFVRPPLLSALFLIDPHADPFLGLDVLQEAARKNPQSWQLRLWHGFYRYAILRDKDRALTELAAAADCPGRPEYVVDVQHFLETASDSLLARVFFTRARQEARTETERRIFQERLDELDAGVGGFGLEHHHEGGVSGERDHSRHE